MNSFRPAYLRYALAAMLVILAFVLTARLGLLLALMHGYISPVWIPAGIALGALLLGGIRLWPAVLIGAWLSNLDSPLEPQFRFLLVCGNTLQAVAGAWLMRHLCNRDIHLRQARVALLLMVPVALGTATIGATFGIIALRLGGTLPVESQAGAWIIWWLGDAVGIVCAAPLLLAWQGMDYRQWRQLTAARALLRALAPALLIAILFLLLPTRLQWLQNLLLLAVFPVPVWTALEGEVLEVALSNFLVAVVVILGTSFDFGPFSSTSFTVTASMLQEQGFVYAVALVALLLVSTRAEQRAGVADLRRSQHLFSTVFAQGPMPITISRLVDGCIYEANPAALNLLGYARAAIVGKTTVELGIWDSAANRAAMVQRMREFGYIELFPLMMKHADGSLLDVLYSAQIVDFSGESCIIATVCDLTARKRAEAQQREADTRFATIFHSSPDAIVISNLQSSLYVEFNDAWVRLCGYSRAEMFGKRALDLGIWVSPEDRNSLKDDLQSYGRVREFAFRLRRKDGSIAEALLSGEIIELRGETCMLAVMSDVTERKRAERNLRDSERRFADVVEAAGEYVWEADTEGRYLYVSPRIEKVLGYRVDEILGKTASDFMLASEVERIAASFAARADADAPIRNLEYLSVRRDGKCVWQQVSAVPFYAPDGARLGYRGTGVDITERKMAEERIEELATRDLLTQLPNRRLMMDRLSQALLVAQRTQHLLGVLLIDLDRFKVVNESLGYGVGDALLKQVATRIGTLLTEGDTLARMGSDEFVVVLPTLRVAEDAGAVAQRIVNALFASFDIDGQSLDTSVSIGISVFPNDASDAATLIRNADMAMSFAKEHRRKGYQYFSPQMNARAVEKMSMESTLKRAIENDEFELHYHPKFSLVDGRLTGAEALLRWHHPQLGHILPAQFIPVAEQTGLIVPLGEWVMRQACSQAAAWRNERGEPLPMAINLSVGQLNRGLALSVHNALVKSGLDARYLELEVTESMLMAHADDNIDTLRQLSDLGIHIAIDDFGTGYSSLAYLRRFHVDTLKVDQSFVRDLETSLDATAIIIAVIALGHSLNLKVIAEGVETRAQQRLLAALNCDECQGFLFTEPLPAAAFALRYLQTAPPNRAKPD